MTEKDKQKEGASVKNRAGADSASPKKKIVIKKPNAPQSKDISDLFSSKSSADAKAAPKKPPGEQKKRPEGTTPAPERPQGSSGQPSTPNQGYQGQGYQGQGYQGQRPGGQGQGYQGQRPGGQGQGYQGQRPGGQGQGYQGQRPGGQGQGYQGQRPGGQGQGYQGQRPSGPGQGYQGQRPGGGRPPGPGGQRQSNFAGSSTPFDAAIETPRKPAEGGTTGRRQPPKKATPAAGDRSRGRDRSERETHDRFYMRAEKKKPATATTVPKQIEILESIQVGELAKKLNLKPGDVIARLMKMGEMVTINKIIDADTATLLAGEYGCEVKVVSLFDETVIDEEKDIAEAHTPRPPVVTIMGHVDHGKTKLLDTIRKTNVVATEAGAITQHIGAYQVQIPRGSITFLDTPGHEAFTSMRARGAAITDIVVLVVAADDGVKEQTIEAITHAKEANVPIIVAINKVDLPAADPERVKKELTQYGLISEEWGGSTIFCEISAKQNMGIEHLLEMILLQAEVLDLRANADLMAVGRVVEAHVDPGKGPVATILVQKGTLHEGDPYVVGVFSGRVRAMFDDLGNRVTVAGPSTPVEISGIDGVPEAGDPFQSVINEKYGREVAGKRQHYKQITDAAQRVHPSLTDLKNWIQDHKELKVIIKADVQGSVEAIREGLLKLSTEDVKVRVIMGATGAISESDVNLASLSNAIIIGFQVRPTPRALDLASRERVEIKHYNVIYTVIEEIKMAMEGLLEPDKIEETTGRAEVRQIFKISKVGNVAGCMMINGKIRRSNRVRLIRDNVVIYVGGLKSLRRHKDEVSEVAEGFECGISIEGYNDIRVGDHVEGFEIKEIARKL